MLRRLSFSVVVLLTLVFVVKGQSDHTHDESHTAEDKSMFDVVTCGSLIKLKHLQSGYRLHSHKINYGSGSGQQSVTGTPDAGDTNSLWMVRPAFGKSCPQGTPLNDGDVIRLEHLNTAKFLHSHLHTSPISSQQEVSAYENTDTGDNWKIEVAKGGSWKRGEPLRLIHVDTSKYLSSSSRNKFSQPIAGQLEVCATGKSSDTTTWATEEGIYFPVNSNKN